MKTSIVLSGPDGTGKSTLIREIIRILSPNEALGVSWRRSGFFLGRIFNLFSRINGRSYYEQTPSGKFGYHKYSGFAGKIYSILVLIDCYVFFGPKWYFKDMIKKNSNRNIIDRYYIDIVADLALSTRDIRYILFLFDNIIKKHLKKVNCFVLACEYENVVQRRPDIKFDKNYKTKQKIYKIIRRLYSIESIHTDQLEVDACTRKIIRKSI